MNSPQKQALEKLRQTRLSSPPRTSAQAYAQMDRSLAAQKSSGSSSKNGPVRKG